MAYDDSTKRSVYELMRETYRGLDSALSKWERDPDANGGWVKDELDDAINRLTSAYRKLRD